GVPPGPVGLGAAPVVGADDVSAVVVWPHPRIRQTVQQRFHGWGRVAGVGLPVPWVADLCDDEHRGGDCEAGLSRRPRGPVPERPRPPRLRRPMRAVVRAHPLVRRNVDREGHAATPSDSAQAAMRSRAAGGVTALPAMRTWSRFVPRIRYSAGKLIARLISSGLSIRKDASSIEGVL